MTRPGQTTALAAALIAGAAVLMAVLQLWAFESYPHSGDEYAYVYQARTFLARRLVNPPAPDVEAFHQVHVISAPQGMYSKYPPGWPAVLAIGEAVGAGALVNPLLVAALLALSFVFARRLVHDRVALVLLALLATSPFVLLNGAGFYSHPWVALLWLVALWAFRSHHRRPRVAPALVLGACYGAIFLARPQDVFFLAPATLVLAALALRRAGPRAGLAHLAVAAAPLAAAVGLFLAYNAGSTGDPWLMGHLVSQPHDHPVFDLASVVSMTGSRTLAYLEVSWVALAGLLWWGPGGRRPFRPLPLLLVLAGLTMLAYGFYPYPDAPPHFGPRYWFPMQPLILLPAAWALARALRPRRLTSAIALVALAQLGQTAFMAYSARLTVHEAAGPERAARILEDALAGDSALVALTGPAGSVPLFDLVRNDLDYRHRVLFVRSDRDPRGRFRFAQGGPGSADGALFARAGTGPRHPLLRKPGPQGGLSPGRWLYLWDGAGGPPTLRAADAEAPVQTLVAVNPPVILGGPPRPGWTVTTAGNRCGKRYYDYPGSRPGDWTRFAACGEVAFSDEAPPGPGTIWPETKRRWFARQYRTSLVVEEPDTYIFRVLADDEARLWVDGREVLRATCAGIETPAEVRLRLWPGLHPVTLSYSNIDIPARLTWSVVCASTGDELTPDRYQTWPARDSRKRP